MANRYVTTADFDALVPTEVRLKLFADSAGSYDATLFNRAAELASVRVGTAAKGNGYDIPADSDGSVTTDDMVKLAVLSILVPWAYGRKSQAVPQYILDTFEGVLEDLKTGASPLEVLSPDALRAVGGVKFTDTSETSTTGTPPVFRDLDESY